MPLQLHLSKCLKSIVMAYRMPHDTVIHKEPVTVYDLYSETQTGDGSFVL